MKWKEGTSKLAAINKISWSIKKSKFLSIVNNFLCYVFLRVKNLCVAINYIKTTHKKTCSVV